MNTTYFLNAVAGNLFRTKTVPALPTKYYLGLSTTTPDADGNGVTEPATTAAYARVELTSLGEPAAGVVSNTEVINFPESTGAWGTMNRSRESRQKNTKSLRSEALLQSKLDGAFVMQFAGGPEMVEVVDSVSKNILNGICA